MTINHIKCEYKLRKKTKFNFLSSDIKWSNKEAPLKYVIAGSITGFISTMLGIGGGMIMNPIMISLGLSPDVVVATSSITTVFSSFISAFQFLLDGIYEWYYPILFGVGCASSIVSLFILKLLKSNMKIGITFILVITLIVSFIFLMVINIMKFI